MADEQLPWVEGIAAEHTIHIYTWDDREPYKAAFRLYSRPVRHPDYQGGSKELAFLVSQVFALLYAGYDLQIECVKKYSDVEGFATQATIASISKLLRIRVSKHDQAVLETALADAATAIRDGISPDIWTRQFVDGAKDVFE